MNAKRAIPPEMLNALIESNISTTNEVLKEVEDNFITSTKAHITYHQQLMEIAKDGGDMAQYMHHRVMLETYETILRNYEASRRYATA